MPEMPERRMLCSLLSIHTEWQLLLFATDIQKSAPQGQGPLARRTVNSTKMHLVEFSLALTLGEETAGYNRLVTFSITNAAAER